MSEMLAFFPLVAGDWDEDVRRRGFSRLLRVLMKCEYLLATSPSPSLPRHRIPRARGRGLCSQVDEPFSFPRDAKGRHRIIFDEYPLLVSLSRAEGIVLVSRPVSNRFRSRNVKSVSAGVPHQGFRGWKVNFRDE
jgi:hypothetical protein